MINRENKKELSTRINIGVELLGKIKIHELAKEIGMSQRCTWKSKVARHRCNKPFK